MKIKDILEIKINKLGYCGEGVHKDKGAVIFVPRALPGDVVKVKIKKLKKNYGSAEIIGVLTPSPDRINPGCRAFTEGCGGCQWLNFNYKAQCYWKTRDLKRNIKAHRQHQY